MTLNDYKHKIYAYFKNVRPDEPIDFDLCKEYYNKYSEEQFDTLVRHFFDIKGKYVTVEAIQKAKRKTDKVMTEHEIQQQVCKYLDKKGYKYWAVPNGMITKLDYKYIAYMKSEGALRKGVFDMTILANKGKVAFLELKTNKGKPSDEQLKWKQYFDNNGYTSGICYGLDECKEFIDEL